MQRGGLLGNGGAHLFRNADRLQAFPCGPQFLSKLLQPGGVFFPEAPRIVLKGHTRPHDFAALLRRVVIPDEDSMREAVEQLRSQVAFFWIHGAHQNEAGVHLPRKSVALQPILPTRGGVQRQVHQVIR